MKKLALLTEVNVSNAPPTASASKTRLLTTLPSILLIKEIKLSYDPLLILSLIIDSAATLLLL